MWRNGPGPRTDYSLSEKDIIVWAMDLNRMTRPPTGLLQRRMSLNSARSADRETLDHFFNHDKNVPGED